MAKYRPIDVRIWNDRKFLSLSDDGRILWLYLLTAPTTLPIPGVIIGGEASMSEVLGWDVRRVRQTIAELFRKQLSVCVETRLVWLPNALRYQPPRNPNMVKGWSETWDDIPECRLKHQLWQALKITCKPWSRLFDQLFAEPTTKQLHQDQDQDQDQEQDLKNSASPSASGSLFSEFEYKLQKQLGDVGLARAKKGGRKRKGGDWTDAEIASARVVLDRLGARNQVEYTGTDEHLKLIINQLRSGRTEMELRIIIGYCASQWAEKPDMLEYLRPETLFGPKTISRYLDPSRAWHKALPPDPDALAHESAGEGAS